MTPIQAIDKIEPDSYRYVNLVLFLLAAVSNSIPCQTFAGIGPSISSIYQISSLQVNANSLFYPILYVVLILPANYIVDQKGIKIATLLCTCYMIMKGQFLMCLGLCIRCLINYWFGFFLIGTFLCSLGFCFITSTANKFPNIWFLDAQIFPIKSLILFALFASDTIGFYISTAYITQKSTKSDVQQFIIIQSSILMLFHILNAAFFRNNPKSPQNYSSQVEHQKYLNSLKQLVNDKNYIKLFITVTFVFANLSIIFVGVAWLGQAYNVSTQQCGYVLVIANAAGLIGCVGSALLMKDQYKRKCQILLCGSFISFGLMWMGFQLKSFWLICMSAGLVGMNIFPFLTTILDLASQTTFPIGEATSGGSLLFGGQTFGFVMIIIFSIFIDESVTVQKCRITQGVLLGFIVIGFVFLNKSKEVLKRKQFEERVIVQQKQSLIRA